MRESFKRYDSPFGLTIDIIYGLICLYILIFRTQDVFGNLESSFIWAYPFTASQLALHRKFNKEKHTNGTDNRSGRASSEEGI